MVWVIFSISHLNRTASDYSSLLLLCDRNTARGPSRFKFLHAWLKHPNCLDVIRQSWSTLVLGRGMWAFHIRSLMSLVVLISKM